MIHLCYNSSRKYIEMYKCYQRDTCSKLTWNKKRNIYTSMNMSPSSRILVTATILRRYEIPFRLCVILCRTILMSNLPCHVIILIMCSYSRRNARSMAINPSTSSFFQHTSHWNFTYSTWNIMTSLQTRVYRQYFPSGGTEVSTIMNYFIDLKIQHLDWGRGNKGTIGTLVIPMHLGFMLK